MRSLPTYVLVASITAFGLTRLGYADQPAKPKEVYAEWNNGLYYKGTVIETKGNQSLVKWDDGSAPVWVDNAKVKPRKGHGLPAAHIGDGEPVPETPAEAKKREELAAKYRALCPNHKTSVACMNSLDPCIWESASKGCQYRGY